MALIKCKECGKEVSNKATKCPNCGAPIVKKGIGCGGLLLIIILSLITIGMISSLSTQQPATKMSPSTRIAPQPTDQLELLSSKGYEEYGYMIVEGQVKNITSYNLKNVEAVAAWYDDKENFITSDSTLAEYNPIVPGQASPFKVMSTHNPVMKKYTISFKYLMGGTINCKDSRK